MSPRWPRIIHPGVSEQPATEESHSPSLRGCSVIWTRPVESTEEMAEALAAAGAEVIEAPAIEFASFVERNLGQFERIMNELRESQGWLILPSPTAIHYFAEMSLRIHLDPAALTGIRLAVISQSSAEQLRQHGLEAHFTPPAPRGQSLAATLPAEPGTPIVIAGSSQTRPELREGLLQRGMRVQVLPLYAPRPCRTGLRAIRQALKAQSGRVVVMTSPSAVDALMEALRPETLRTRPAWVAIGPTTYRRLLDWGVRPECSAQAATPTTQGIIDAIRDAIRDTTRSVQAPRAQGPQGPEDIAR